MSVIKDEFISEKITKYDLLPLGFLKKSPYTGSKGKLRYRIEMTEEGEGDQKKRFLRVNTWTTPFAFDHTPEEERTVSDFAFSEQGLEEIIEYLNKNTVL